MTKASVLVMLRKQLARFDDDAFATLANRGLLRRARKDLESVPVALVTDEPARVEITVATHRVTFDARGPANATCSCPASGVCQHILTACLFLQAPPAAPEKQSQAAAQTPAQPAEDIAAADVDALRAALLALDARALQAWGGKAALRWAIEFVAEQLEPEMVSITGERHIAIEFAHPRIAFRYMGGGLDAIVTDYAGRDQKKHVVAAVLAYQRALGAELPRAETQRTPVERELDLGKTHALAEAAPAALERLRNEVLASADGLLRDCVEIGLSHLSEAIQQRLTTLAVSAQGAELFRLAASLRRLADQTGWLLDRQGGADESRLLGELARTYALIGALRAAAKTENALRPRALVGEARGRYASIARIELLALAVWPWRAASGYHGLTQLFWSPEEKNWFTFTEARPIALAGFEPRSRFDSIGPWTGALPPKQLLGRRFALIGAEASHGGRLSSTRDTALNELGVLADTAQLPPALAQWRELERVARDAGGRGLAERDPRRNYVVLQPARTDRARFDTTRQTMVWTLYDDSDTPLAAELEYSALNENALAYLEAMPEQSASSLRVIATIRRAGGVLKVEPLGLLQADGLITVIPVHFASPPTQGWLARSWRRLVGGAKQDADANANVAPIATVPPVLTTLRATLLRAAERGVGRAGARADAALAGLPAALAACERAHLNVLVDIARRAGATGERAPARSVLSLAYAADQLAAECGAEVEASET
jgi:hypothetical protein